MRRSITVIDVIRNAAARLSSAKESRALEVVADLIQETEGDLAARIIPVAEDESRDQIGHICPHCKREPATLSAHLVQFGAIPAMVFSCSGCRKLISVSTLPPLPRQPEINRESSLILTPRA